MKLIDILKDIQPGMVIHNGKEDDSNYVEIFVLNDKSLRFADPLMTIDNKLISSDKWEF